jgi:phosphopantothenoylcysteine synthetase/decarboxylase
LEASFKLCMFLHSLSVLHIELRKWADVLVVAPLSANTLAKVAGGLCDNLLTSVVRAWDFSKPFLGEQTSAKVWRMVSQTFNVCIFPAL